MAPLFGLNFENAKYLVARAEDEHCKLQNSSKRDSIRNNADLADPLCVHTEA